MQKHAAYKKKCYEKYVWIIYKIRSIYKASNLYNSNPCIFQSFNRVSWLDIHP